MLTRNDALGGLRCSNRGQSLMGAVTTERNYSPAPNFLNRASAVHGHFWQYSLKVGGLIWLQATFPNFSGTQIAILSLSQLNLAVRHQQLFVIVPFA